MFKFQWNVMNCLFVMFILVQYNHLTDFKCKCATFFQTGNQWQNPTDPQMLLYLAQNIPYIIWRSAIIFVINTKTKVMGNNNKNIKNNTTFKHGVMWQHLLLWVYTDGTYECWAGSRFRGDELCWDLVPASASVWLSRRLLWLTVSAVTLMLMLMSWVEGESGSSSTACHPSRPTSASFR